MERSRPRIFWTGHLVATRVQGLGPDSRSQAKTQVAQAPLDPPSARSMGERENEAIGSSFSGVFESCLQMGKKKGHLEM